MNCTHASVTVESYEEPTLGATSGSDIGGDAVERRRNKRRHSSYHIRRTSSGAWEDDVIRLRVGGPRILETQVKLTGG
jgi:hypothetical protein